GARGRRGGTCPRPGNTVVTVRPPDLRPHTGGSAVRLPLPARDVRPEGKARVRLFRPAAPRRRPRRRSRRAGLRPEDADLGAARCVGRPVTAPPGRRQPPNGGFGGA